MAPRISDAAEVDRLYRLHRRNIIVVITLCYGLGYVCRLAFNVVKKPIMDAGIFTPEQAGLIGSMLLYGYAAGKFGNGFLADYSNVKRFFAFGILMSALLNFGMSLSTMLGVSALLWAFNGWFQGFGAPSAVVALANWFGNDEARPLLRHMEYGAFHRRGSDLPGYRISDCDAAEGARSAMAMGFLDARRDLRVGRVSVVPVSSGPAANTGLATDSCVAAGCWRRRQAGSA